MHKFTIFSIIFSFMVILVVAELVVNDYLNKEITPPKSLEMGQANILVDEDAVITETEPEVVGSEAAALPGFQVTQELLAKSEFTEPVFRAVEFNGKYFQLIDVSDFAKGVKKANIFENQRFAGAIYENHLANAEAAYEFYQLLQAEGQKSIENQINETNAYGDNSFYVNNRNKNATAFLVIKLEKSVFAFEYPHRSHSKIKALINNLAEEAERKV